MVFIFEHDKLVGWNTAVDHLPIFVIRHGGDAIGLLLQKRVNIEALLQYFHATFRAVRLDAKLRHPAQERIFIAVEPNAERTVLKIGWRLDAGFGAAGQHHAGTFERLRDIDQRHALFTGRQSRWHPVDHNVSAATGKNLRRRHIRAARLDGDVKTRVLVKALILGHVIARKLRLRDPFKL